MLQNEVAELEEFIKGQGKAIQAGPIIDRIADMSSIGQVVVIRANKTTIVQFMNGYGQIFRGMGPDANAAAVELSNNLVGAYL